MGFGHSKKYIANIQISGLSDKEALLIALETVNELDWNLGFINNNKLVAHTNFSMSSWGEEVKITIERGNISIESQCIGGQLIDWGKNKKNISVFTSTFNRIREQVNLNELHKKHNQIETNFVPDENKIIDQHPSNQIEKITNFFSIFKPTEGYLVTPILINANILIFILMAVAGVNIMLPDNESLLLWGANFRPLTLEGEWWRLLSSCFVHIGIFHLLMNMYALLYIGLILEPYLGKSRFISAYLLTGLASSAISLYWNDFTISAGASGAIFGMYGVFLAMLTTNLIEKSARKSLLISIGVFVGYYLLNGIKGGIDNAAHIGGLVTGLMIGYAFYPSFIKPKMPKLKFITIGLLSLIVLSSSFAILSVITPSDIGEYERKMEQFAILEEKALGIFELPDTLANQVYLDEIENVGIPNWQKSLEILKEVEQLELPDAIKKRNLKLIAYCNLRIRNYELIYKAISKDTDSYEKEIDSNNNKIMAIIEELSH